jgi:Spy/CpxP family protein refolding chaperone
MALEQFRAQIAMIMDEIAAQPEDAHELQERLREKLAEMRALGLAVPEDLAEFEDALEEDLEEGVPLEDGATPPADPAA